MLPPRPGPLRYANGAPAVTDADNYIVLWRSYCDSSNGGTCNGNGIYFEREVNATVTQGSSPLSPSVVDTAFLRITKSGNAYEGFYSEDGSIWMSVGTHMAADLATNGKVGVFTELGGSTNTGKIASFDYFGVAVQ